LSDLLTIQSIFLNKRRYILLRAMRREAIPVIALSVCSISKNYPEFQWLFLDTFPFRYV
jgi:hypothetical protein